jgi:hypothetical protein
MDNVSKLIQNTLRDKNTSRKTERVALGNKSIKNVFSSILTSAKSNYQDNFMSNQNINKKKNFKIPGNTN